MLRVCLRLETSISQLIAIESRINNNLISELLFNNVFCAVNARFKENWFN